MIARRPSVMETADSIVSITVVMRLLGVRTPHDPYGRKLYCPFGELYHRDRGAEPALRVYEDNHAFCFAGCGYLSPVSMAALGWGIPRRAAAAELLNRTGVGPPSLKQRWNDALDPVPEVDTASLAEALKVFCARVSLDWFTDQFRTHVAERLGQCLALLEQVRTPHQAQQWLDGCKTVMERVLTSADPGQGQ